MYQVQTTADMLLPWLADFEMMMMISCIIKRFHQVKNILLL